ncbi:aldehyde dehydrogenase family protein [Bradyrhizobium yuanmingense]|uniref:aldehyde dehydrogenase family protein n=1 Tax=Bradyrhizobium yuanmingense TaxID=108015 RepID=UPI0023BA29F2|nr:aldehyde dehydrogenase family protein [Bradyrhizobium yuanmingense]MDF0584934.1 aldehyde dehydrogenase family protein [Bradyrhizobium yuanmingense]
MLAHDDAPRLAVPDKAAARARMKVDRAGWAVRAYGRYDRACVMKVARAVAEAAHQFAQTYAEWAVRETGMGVVEHKRLKNELSAHPLVDFYSDTNLVDPRIDNARKMVELPKPAGIILALTPATNPISTLYYKTILALLSRNAVIFSPHPMAKECCRDAAARLEAAAVAAGAPAGLIQCIEEPSVPLVQALMMSPNVQVILATGGSAMVRAAYSSGNPAIGVGPGNAPVYVDPSANQGVAAQRIVESKAFDNSVLCTNESVLISLEENRQLLERGLRAAGAHICTDAEVAKLRDWLFPHGHLNTAAVGKSAVWVAQQAGIHVVPSTKTLIAPVERFGSEEPLTKEKLCPVLAFVSVESFERAVSAATMILRVTGAGHSAAFHGENPQRAVDFASALPVYRIVVNAPCSQGAAGFATHLAPSFMIGTGYFGRSSVGENIGPQHLVHWTRLAWNSDAAVPLSDLSAVRVFSGGSGARSAASPPAPTPTVAQGNGLDRDLLRQLILQELRELTRGQS